MNLEPVTRHDAIAQLVAASTRLADLLATADDPDVKDVGRIAKSAVSAALKSLAADEGEAGDPLRDLADFRLIVE